MVFGDRKIKAMTCFSFCIGLSLVSAILVGLLARTAPFFPLSCHFGVNCPNGRDSVNGFVAPGYELVREAFEKLYSDGHEIGSQFAVFKDGQLVVNLYGGVIKEDSLAVVYSSSKVVASLVVAMLADRGLLELNAPISKYWPEFAQHGKEKITVHELMTHSAGIPVLDFDIDIAKFKIGSAEADALLAKQKSTTFPLQKGAKKMSAYHGLTRGLFIDKLCRLVDGRSIGRFVAEEIADKVGAEFYFGAGAVQERVVKHVGIPAWAFLVHLLPQILLPSSLKAFYDEHTQLLDQDISVMGNVLFKPDSLMAKSLKVLHDGVHLRGAHEVANLPEFRAAEYASASGVSNAKSMATIANVLARGGPPLLSSEGLQRALQYEEYYDALLDTKFNFTTVGWARDRVRTERLDDNFGWFGAGGSAMQFSPKHGYAFAYVPTYLAPRVSKPRMLKLWKALDKTLLLLESKSK